MIFFLAFFFGLFASVLALVAQTIGLNILGNSPLHTTALDLSWKTFLFLGLCEELFRVLFLIPFSTKNKRNTPPQHEVLFLATSFGLGFALLEIVWRGTSTEFPWWLFVLPPLVHIVLSWFALWGLRTFKRRSIWEAIGIILVITTSIHLLYNIAIAVGIPK